MASWLGFKGTSSKDSVCHKQGCSAEVHHFVETCVSKQSNSLKTRFHNCQEFKDQSKIIERFRESGEISACKGQGQKPTVNACDL